LAEYRWFYLPQIIKFSNYIANGLPEQAGAVMLYHKPGQTAESFCKLQLHHPTRY